MVNWEIFAIDDAFIQKHTKNVHKDHEFVPARVVQKTDTVFFLQCKIAWKSSNQALSYKSYKLNPYWLEPYSYCCR